MHYYLVESGNSVVIYDTLEALIAHIYYDYYDYYDKEITIKNVYKIYDFKRNDLLSVSVYVDKQANDLLTRLNSKFDSRGNIDITYYLFKKTENILTGVGRKYIAPCRNIWQLIHN